MIYFDLIESFPEEAYVHPLYEGQGWDGRKYRPVWHAVRGDHPVPRASRGASA